MQREIKIHFLIPSKTKIHFGESLNILIGIHNENISPVKHVFRIFGDIGHGYKEIFSAEKFLTPGGNPHHYFNIPAHCFTESFRNKDFEEIFLATSEDGENAQLIFIA